MIWKIFLLGLQKVIFQSALQCRNHILTNKSLGFCVENCFVDSTTRCCKFVNTMSTSNAVQNRRKTSETVVFIYNKGISEVLIYTRIRCRIKQMHKTLTCSSLTVYRLSKAFFSALVRTWCSGTRSCIVMFTIRSASCTTDRYLNG
jgi:hypothetical protein